jgi:cytochrome P450
MTTKADTDGLELVDPAYYGQHGPPHDVWRTLRAEDPLHYCDNGVYPPFYAVTKHADIMELSSRPDTFLNQPGIVLTPLSQPQRRDDGIGAMRTIIEMDPPEHRDYRKVASPYFTPRSIQQLEAATIESARGIVDRLAGDTGEGEADWAFDVAAAHPLRVLSTILGIPREQEPLILRLTNQLFAADDDELKRPAADRETALMELGMELYGLFDAIITDRRANPTDDLASVIANGKVNGEDMGPMETFGYCLIAFTAGHDTTKNALAGGLNAFIEHPDQLAMLKADPDLVNTAVDEVVRWSTPVNYMMRTVAHDVDFRGRSLKQGDRLIQFYASANRDEDVFDDPYSFHIDRQNNRQLGFGIGEHFCLGAHLARMSQRALFREFAKRLEWVERTADPVWIKSSFVVGYKHLPVRYRFSK